jgi:hypothetical protein
MFFRTKVFRPRLEFSRRFVWSHCNLERACFLEPMNGRHLVISRLAIGTAHVSRDYFAMRLVQELSGLVQSPRLEISPAK